MKHTLYFAFLACFLACSCKTHKTIVREVKDTAGVTKTQTERTIQVTAKDTTSRNIFTISVRIDDSLTFSEIDSILNGKRLPNAGKKLRTTEIKQTVEVTGQRVETATTEQEKEKTKIKGESKTTTKTKDDLPLALKISIVLSCLVLLSLFVIFAKIHKI
jgi:hypothetical protein